MCTRERGRRVWRLACAGLALGALASAPAAGDLDLGPVEFVQANGGDILVPGWSVPSYAHWDDDGLMDMIVGEGGMAEAGKIRIYLNDGTPDSPNFTDYFYAQSNGADLIVPPDGCQGAFPRMVHWDADNRKDLLVGLADGRVMIFLNIGTNDHPTFDGGSFVQVGQLIPQDINVGLRATPTFVDWNGDGWKDLVVGALDGRIHIFINEGTIDPQPVFWFETFAQQNGADLIVPTERSSPHVADFTGDNGIDLLTGNTEGQLLLYPNTGMTAEPTFSYYIEVQSNYTPIDLDGEPRTRPFACDWTGDGYTDVLLGAGDGMVRLYQGLIELIPKWSQRPLDCSVNFDAASDVGWPDPNLPGIDPVNKVVADDFYSDGRPIEAVRWWGSYFDERYLPPFDDTEHQMDGWLITFHWADINTYPGCPPDILFDDHPTALGVYYAPVRAVSISGLDCTDCLGHALYEYDIDLAACCLICSEPDPRNGDMPAQEGAFFEQNGYRYWLSIQAVAGIEWLPPECEPRLTGHVPSDLPGTDGHFWGWHSTQLEPAAIPNDEACTGAITPFPIPYPPDCWDYGQWIKQPYMCPNGDDLPVHMSFQLLAEPCVGDVDGDGDTDLSDLAALLAAYDSVIGDPNHNPNADFDGDGDVDLSDLAFLLADYGCGRFAP